MSLPKKKQKNIENCTFGGFLNFEIDRFLQFWNIFRTLKIIFRGQIIETKPQSLFLFVVGSIVKSLKKKSPKNLRNQKFYKQFWKHIHI